MAMNVDDLAIVINDAIAATDKDNKKIEVTPEMKSYAKAIIETYKACTTAHSPGSVKGQGGAPGPLSAGEALGGMVVGMTPGPMAGELAGGIPGGPATSDHAVKCVGYLSVASKIDFTAGKIQGVSTATTEAPGVLAAGSGSSGKVLGLTGSAWAPVVMPGGGDPSLTQRLYQAISDYIAKNAEVTYTSGSVTGTFAVGGGDLIAGAAAGGTIK